ncbi:lipid A biosynthesis lauroyl acyltransferase [Salinisphaera dokdonensis CL-ES53]|uniref:Lipid A biosynthesis lauroyl acyltransferase n=1 Tax=Salinisphaera dokdonensis CL-ES53 TaxID=1304272 RepID=A0ABV2B4A4_9GAMM
MADPAPEKDAPSSLRAPRYWGSWVLMGLGWLLSQLPYRLQMGIGRFFGNLAYHVIGERRRVADVNLRLCFPELGERERYQILRDHFRSVGMGAIETAICWWGPTDKIQSLAHIEGLEHLEAAAERGRGIILLSAHFTSLELGVRMAKGPLRELGYVTTAMYKAPHDPVVDHVMRTRREAHIGGSSIRDDDVKGLLKALRRKDAVWYAADQKPPKRLGVVVDFFGQPARTHVALSRLARMTKASVVPFFTLRREDGNGYRLIIKPSISDSLGEDETADAQRINAMIESVVREAPAQYFWLHQRFKRSGYNPYKPAAKTEV